MVWEDLMQVYKWDCTFWFCMFVRSLNDTILAADDELTDPAMDFGVFSHRGLHSGEDPVSLKAHLNGTCQPCFFNE